jgi:hypothetical protein
MNTTNNAAPSEPRAEAADAISLLKADYERLMGLFAEYERTHSSARKMALASAICTELSVHVQIKEEIFYPEVAAALQGKLSSDAQDGIAALIGPLGDFGTQGEMCDPRIRAMSVYLQRYVREEQQRIFPQVRESLLDLFEIGARMAARKADLLAEAAGAHAGQLSARPRLEFRAG